MSGYKGFISNKKKGSLAGVVTADVFVTEKPQKPHVETDPTVPQHVKAITAQEIQNWVTGFNNNIISGSVTGDTNKILTLTKRNGTVLQIPFNDLQGLTADDVINTLNFNTSTGVLTAVTSEGIQITTNFDGRYALLNHTHPAYANKIVTGVSFSGTSTKTCKITFADGTFITGTFTDMVGTSTTADGNNYVTSGVYNHATREVTLTRNDGGTVKFTVNIRKVGKIVDTATYVLKSDDQHLWLIFDQSCTVTIPTGLVADDLFEGEASTGATVTFQAASGVTLRHVASVSKILSPNGVFGIRFRALNNCVLYGTDPVNYAG